MMLGWVRKPWVCHFHSHFKGDMLIDLYLDVLRSCLLMKTETVAKSFSQKPGVSAYKWSTFTGVTFWF